MRNTSSSHCQHARYATTQRMWLFDTLLYLRDDLVACKKLTPTACPPPSIIEQWVRACYHDGLAEQEWLPAMQTLITRMKTKVNTHGTYSEEFVQIIQQHLRGLAHHPTH